MYFAGIVYVYHTSSFLFPDGTDRPCGTQLSDVPTVLLASWQHRFLRRHIRVLHAIFRLPRPISATLAGIRWQPLVEHRRTLLAFIAHERSLLHLELHEPVPTLPARRKGALRQVPARLTLVCQHIPALAFLDLRSQTRVVGWARTLVNAASAPAAPIPPSSRAHRS